MYKSRLLLLLLSLHRPRAQTLWATGDSVIVSLPDSKGSSQVLSVGELVARSGPAIGDKVAVDRPSCTAGLVPGSDMCVIPQALVFGKVLPISSVPTVTPPPDPLTYNTIRGRVTDFAANPLSGATVVIKGKAAGEEINISTTTDVDGYYTATVPSDGVFTSTATYVVPQTELGRKFRSSEQAKPAEYTGTTAIWSGSSADGHGYVDVAVTSPTAATYAAFSAALTWRDTPTWQAIPDVFFSLTEPVSRPAVTTQPSLNSRPSTVATGGVKIETWTSGGVIYAPTSDPPEVTYAPDATTDLWGSWFKRVTAVLIPAFTGSTTIKVQADDMFTLYLNGINVLSGNDWSQQYYVDVPLTVGTPVLFLLDVINVGGPGSISVQYTTEDGSYRTFDATIAFPGTKISLLAFPLSTVPSWAALQAQAFLRFGNSQLALRAPADTAPIPAVATIADCPTLPLWYIADVDFVTGLVPINKIIYNAAVTCSETAKLFG